MQISIQYYISCSWVKSSLFRAFAIYPTFLRFVTSLSCCPSSHCSVFVCTGPSASQMDVTWKYLWVCVHIWERRLVLWHFAMGNLLAGCVTHSAIVCMSDGLWHFRSVTVSLHPIQEIVPIPACLWTPNSTNWLKKAIGWMLRNLRPVKCELHVKSSMLWVRIVEVKHECVYKDQWRDGITG